MDMQLNTPRLCGVVRAPSSKSEAHRHLIAAALAGFYGAGYAVRRVRCTDLNEDIEATVRCLSALGASIAREGEDFVITPIRQVPETAVLDCGESGSTMRFLLPVVCALGNFAPAGYSVSMVGHGRLPTRPLSPLYEELVAHGAVLSPQGRSPLTVRGALTAGDFAIDGGVSSQFVSGLFFALPILDGNSRVEVTGRVESAPYIGMTLDAISTVTHAIVGDIPSLSIIGRGTATAHQVDAIMTAGGDWSGASFFLVAGVLGGEGTAITLTGLDAASQQGDRAIVDILRRMGGRVDWEGDKLIAHPSCLHGCVIDATQVPDLVPVLSVAAAVAAGETRITGAARLRIKESDRLRTVHDMLTALGGDITETDDGLIIRGVQSLCGGVVDAAGDHRIAMSAAVASTRAAEMVTVTGAEAVAKSYPAFWEEFARMTI